MAKSTAKTFFESGFFEIREPFALPDHIAAQLAPEANPVITAGYYPVAVSETGYTVIF